MTSNARVTYSHILQNARDQRLLTIAATRAVIERRARRHTPRKDLIADIEGEIDALIVEQEERTVVEIETALRRLRESPATYGYCERCGQPITADYLSVAPWATVCERHEEHSAAALLA